MRQPASHNIKYDSQGRPMVWRLLRPIYGLKQSGHIFASVLHGYLEDELKMTRLVSDRCAFVKSGDPTTWDGTEENTHGKLDHNGGQLIVLSYVDDLTIIGSRAQIDWLMKRLRNRFTLQETETGDIDYILSIGITRDRTNGTISLNQIAAIEKIAQALDITYDKPSVQTPMKVTPLTKLEQPSDDPTVKNFPYLETIGSLLHISQCTRPDISYAVGALAQHSLTVGPEHVKAAKRVVQYLYNTRTLCIKYGHSTNINEPLVYEAGRAPDDAPLPIAYSDADYAMNKPTRRSTSGGVIFLNGGPITWSSKLQKITALSTAEAEIIAATDITKEIVHLRLLLSELNVRDNSPIAIHEDNQACILMGNGMKSSRAAKHYEIRLHYLPRYKNLSKTKSSSSYTVPPKTW